MKKLTVSIQYEVTFEMEADESKELSEQVADAADEVAAPLFDAIKKAEWDPWNASFEWIATTAFDGETGEELFDVS